METDRSLSFLLSFNFVNYSHFFMFSGFAESMGRSGQRIISISYGQAKPKGPVPPPSPPS
jgi:hypothetical protein